MNFVINIYKEDSLSIATNMTKGLWTPVHDTTVHSIPK